jgi:hypothetical protein
MPPFVHIIYSRIDLYSNGSNVPETEIIPKILKACYRESCRTDSAWQLPLSAKQSF